MLRFYLALINQDENAGPEDGYGVVFPDLPGCVTVGETVQEAAVMAADAAQLHIDGMMDDGEAIPEPSPPDAPEPEWFAEVPGKIVARVMVPVEIPGGAVRVDIRLDEELLARLDKAAGAEGETRSGYIARAVRERLVR